MDLCNSYYFINLLPGCEKSVASNIDIVYNMMLINEILCLDLSNYGKETQNVMSNDVNDRNDFVSTVSYEKEVI